MSTTVVHEQIIEIVSDSGEGAQTAGQLFGTLAAKMGNGVWTVEIIPAEIEPPPRSRAGASGVRVRFGSHPITNMGDAADLVVAFNEQVLYGRIDAGALRPGTVILLDDKWTASPEPAVRDTYRAGVADLRARGYDVREIPMEAETRRLTDTPRRGQNMWVTGLLCALYDRDLETAKTDVAAIFNRRRKGPEVVAQNHALLDAGHAYGLAHFPERFSVPPMEVTGDMVVMNGNAAVAMGAMAAGIELCAMYPITPATSASHYLGAAFHNAGGFVHQAEDEIAAVSFAIGASYAGKTAMTITSGPGMALKTEMIGLAVMTEVPLVIVDVQRGGPSTGLPTKVEQGDLLHALFAAPGDAPKVVMAASSIDECFHFMVTARSLAETFRTPVIVLTDANLATGQTAFAYPKVDAAWLSPPVDQTPWPPGIPPYAWNEATGLSPRPVPGQAGGTYVLTGLAHDERSRVAYEADINQRAMERRSRKLAALAASLRPPVIHGDPDGELLVVGWGSTRGAIEEAVDQVRAEGHRVSSVHLRFLSPLEPGLAAIFARFARVMTVELNYSDPPDAPGDRRHAQLAWVLRAATLVDVDSWSRVPGAPLPPGTIARALRERLGAPATRDGAAP